ncbi:type IV pilus assembly protein PilO [Oikeobacillus pervagus]|uniref:Type IV pilus assembly protein PilO n=1 Tax=Oikeobacillus pervagus TaxID=1325931 RepID=A0AAJ1WG08_9BACI|nr:hypothetical protein [Oikeobacillus pervagus]MDQ0214547.1 type IV pilus assembly protein PilO [Oikeobacillus pervagus]
MSFFQEKRNIWILSLAILLLIGIIMITYIFYYRPVTEDINRKEKQLQSEEKLIEVLEKNDRSSTTQNRVVTSNLQQKIPVKPMTDKLLLDLEKVELMSHCLIESMDFKDDETSDETGIDGAEEKGKSRPAEIKELTAELTVISPGYFEMQEFLSGLEQQIRTIKIEEIIFDVPDEATKLKGEGKEFTFNVTIQTYYMPNLVDLLKDLPKIDTPGPANKKSPFVIVGD